MLYVCEDYGGGAGGHLKGIHEGRGVRLKPEPSNKPKRPSASMIFPPSQEDASESIPEEASSLTRESQVKQLAVQSLSNQVLRANL